MNPDYRLAMLAGTLTTDATVPASAVTGLSGSHTHVWNETPAGTVDGANATFILAGAPTPAGSLLLFKNGLLQQAGGGQRLHALGPDHHLPSGQPPAN